jgi:hypothetical protein
MASLAYAGKSSVAMCVHLRMVAVEVFSRGKTAEVRRQAQGSRPRQGPEREAPPWGSRRGWGESDD